MAILDFQMPKMGESIMEATIIKWHKKLGDHVELDEILLEIATDKVDSEIPSPLAGIVEEILYHENDVVQIGDVIARINSESGQIETKAAAEEVSNTKEALAEANDNLDHATLTKEDTDSGKKKFISPLVKSIANREGINEDKITQMVGSGADGRITKADILALVKEAEEKPLPSKTVEVYSNIPTLKYTEPTLSDTIASKEAPSPQVDPVEKPQRVTSMSGEDEIIEMDRMRRLIADHMVNSKRTSPHVTSFIEVDVTPIVIWREKVKQSFEAHYGEKITYTPIFIQAVARAIQDFPLINVSVDGHSIIKKKNINIGMATALPTGNLIVPVIKNADQLNLLGVTKKVNDLALRARTNKLSPDEIQGGTFTLTNVGTFGNVMGTPIINQPQVAIMSVGAIKKKPAVIETPAGDSIGIRHMMFISLSYDHRVVDGMLGGSFLRRVGDYLERFDSNTPL